jgi:hypothetical protein
MGLDSKCLSDIETRVNDGLDEIYHDSLSYILSKKHMERNWPIGLEMSNDFRVSKLVVITGS